MTDIEKLLMQMIEFDRGDAFRTQHFLKVYEFSRLIAAGENTDEKKRRILEAAAVLHDIGILPCEKKFGKCNGKMQEEYGPAYARKLLFENGGYTEEETERICDLIAHHHTYGAIDGEDYQILVEADFLVNALEEDAGAHAIAHMREKLFRTFTGIRLLDTMYTSFENNGAKE